MENILSEQEACIGRGESVLDTNTLFHNRLAGAAKNRVMERLLHALIDLLHQAREDYLSEDERNARAKRSLDGHKQILNAVKNSDCDGALKLMLQHLEDIERIIFP
jgi:DNA-binding FadR family transcriptional regulator